MNIMKIFKKFENIKKKPTNINTSLEQVEQYVVKWVSY